MDVYSENSYGVCVPVNSSANEVIVGMARAAALSSSGETGSGTFPLLSCSSSQPTVLADRCPPAARQR